MTDQPGFGVDPGVAEGEVDGMEFVAGSGVRVVAALAAEGVGVG